MKVIVTGGRRFIDHKLFLRVIEGIWPARVVVGDCPTGADLMARRWATATLTLPAKVYVADWTKYDKAAGPIRNALMLEENRDASFLLAFPGEAGTEDCVSKARKMNLPVLRVL